MERILVGIDASRPSWEALVRALCLASRIESRVLVLVVFENGDKGRPPGGPVLEEVETRIRSAKAAGATVTLAVARGRFDKEIVDAAKKEKATLVVAANPDGQSGERETSSLGGILGGVGCRVELVSRKRNHEGKKDVTR